MLCDTEDPGRKLYPLLFGSCRFVLSLSSFLLLFLRHERERE